MEQVTPILVFVALLAGWTWLLHKRSDGRIWSPLWVAFSTTASAILFMVSGLTGYTLSKSARAAAGTAWSETIIWWEVGVGTALVAVAVFFWRKGLRDLAR